MPWDAEVSYRVRGSGRYILTSIRAAFVVDVWAPAVPDISLRFTVLEGHGPRRLRVLVRVRVERSIP